jgi:hypothetical protein
MGRRRVVDKLLWSFVYIPSIFVFAFVLIYLYFRRLSKKAREMGYREDMEKWDDED